jgi:tripartite ATP-independent transporter DctP family solute receptor
MSSSIQQHLVIAALCSLCTLAQAAPRTLMLAEVQKPDHPVVKSEEFMNKLLSERSKGTLQIDVRHSGELGTDVMPRLVSGELDMARISMTTLNKYSPIANLMSMPYLFRSREHMWSILRSDFGMQMAKEAETAGVIVLCFFESGSRNFYSVKKPLRSRQDFSGLRVRVPPNLQVYSDLIKNLGAEPVTVAYSEVLNGLKDGTIDAAENNLPSYVGSGHHKVARYLSIDEHLMVPEILVISRKVWGGLTPEQQTMMRETASEASGFMSKLWEKEESDAIAEAKKAGVVIIEKNKLAYTGFESAAIKLYSTYVTDPRSMETALKIMQKK